MQSRITLFILFFSALTGFAELDSRQAREAVLVYFDNQTESAGRDELTRELSKELDARLTLNAEELQNFSIVADCVRFLDLIETNSITRETAQWILESEERLHLLVETVQPSDNIPRCFDILDELRTFDSAERDAWYELMLALAVVWDEPKRPVVHRQMGEDLLPYEADLCERYRYFKKLYAGGSAKMPYQKLGVGELIFVVETPVPLSELRWACANEKGSRQSWGRKFYSIDYDHERLYADQYDWPWGDYELAEIKSRGGICVDQAYYAVMTARAFGIPAIYFHAMGKGGGHAWFSFMVQPGNWNLDVGRYESQEYTTGLAINPQNNKRMTDHDIAYTCERSLHSQDFRDANAYVALAEVLSADPRNRLRCAREARERVERYLRPWEIETEVLLEEKKFSELLELFGEQQRVFRDHPDILMASAERIEPALRSAGWREDADRLRRCLAREVDDGRDDLLRFLGREEIVRLMEKGDHKKARRRMEQLLEDHLEDGAKAIPMIDTYLDITKESEQTGPAVRFLERYVEDFESSSGSEFKCSLLRYLLEAYENDDDRKGIAQTKRRLSCYTSLDEEEE